jgi:hypothetical protein
MNPISFSAFALGLAAAVSITCAAAETPVYKCMQDGVALYTDTPCKDAALVEIHPGVADPAARVRLERAQAALDRSAVRRKANEELESARRDEIASLRREAEAVRSPIEAPVAYPDAGYVPAWGYYSPARPHRARPPKRLDRPRFAPPPPYVIPRRGAAQPIARQDGR